MPPLGRETSVSRTANVGTVGMNGITLADWVDYIAVAVIEAAEKLLSLFVRSNVVGLVLLEK